MPQPTALYLRNDSWYSFLLEAESNIERLVLKQISDLIGTLTLYFTACIIVPQNTIELLTHFNLLLTLNF
jgi:hypothetical protein